MANRQPTIRIRFIRRIRLLALLGLIVSPVALFGAILKFVEHLAIEEHGVNVQGNVLDHRIMSTGKGRRLRIMTVQYRVSNTKIMQKEFRKIRESDFESGIATGKVTVRFLPAEPEVSAIGATFKADPVNIVICGGVFVLSLLGWVYARWRIKSYVDQLFELGMEDYRSKDESAY